jgi:hypothetical protein
MRPSRPLTADQEREAVCAPRPSTVVEDLLGDEMSKKTVTIDADVCDSCGAQTYVTPCLKCGVEHCWECKDKLGRNYSHGIHVSGSGDGYYCNPCDTELSRSGADPLHNAYVEIRQVRADGEAFYQRFKVLGEQAEAKLKALRS